MYKGEIQEICRRNKGETDRNRQEQTGTDRNRQDQTGKDRIHTLDRKSRSKEQTGLNI